MTKIIVFDLDGTIANLDHRRHLVDPTHPAFPGKKDWDEFARRCIYDTSFEAVIRILNHLWDDSPWYVQIWTGRFEKYRKDTMEWLAHNHVMYDALRMRPDGDYTPDHELKEQWLFEVGGAENILCTFDDRQRVVDMWRRNGVQCFQTADGNF